MNDLNLTVGVLAALAIAAALALRRALLVVTVRGDSMAPALADGERVLAVRRPPGRAGAVVVVRGPAPPGGQRGLVVKRVLAIGGGTASVALDRLARGADPTRTGGRVEGGVATWEVPPGHVFVKGDGRSSADSASWGPVPLADVVGVVVRRVQLGADR